MPQILPLFLPNRLLELVDRGKVNRDTAALKDYFDRTDSQKVKQLLTEQNDKWKNYLEQLAKPRRKRLFNTEERIPDENTKIAQLAGEGNTLAIELQIITKTQPMYNRTWPLQFLEVKRKEYLEVKSRPYSGVEQHLHCIISNALAEIYFPDDFFASRIFKLEPKYSTFPFDFLEDILGPRALYVWYLIYIEKGPENFFDNVQDVIVNRYRVKKIFSMSVYGLLNFFMSDGNDQNRCNRFFTRRMKKDITHEVSDWCSLTNSIGGEYEEVNFKDFFLSNPWSSCNIRDPFQKTRNSEPGLIEQAVYNHLVGNYSATVNLLFPIIEGICWDISVAEHLANGGIYTEDSDLTKRDRKKRFLFDERGRRIQVRHGAPTLNELLTQTKMKDIFHTQFLKTICSELFPVERNPILHGVTLDYNSPFQSARLLLVLEYLHRLIKKRGYRYPDQLDPAGYWTQEKSKAR